jgi:hypothetical protein
VDLRHHGSALPDGGADALHRSGAHIADREHARHAGLERQRKIVPRGNETLFIDRDVAILEPRGARVRAEEQEHVADRPRFVLA